MLQILQISAVLLMALSPLVARAGGLDRIEAVRAAFGCAPEVLTLTPTDLQRQQIMDLGMRAVPQTVTRYRPSCSDPKDRRSAYVMTRTVRTLPQTLLLVVADDSTIEQVVLLDFQEPAEYRGTKRWYQAFRGRVLNDDLHLQRAIPMMAGATITSRSTTQVVRDALALHAVLVAN